MDRGLEVLVDGPPIHQPQGVNVIVVTGASGRLGRLVAEGLAAAGRASDVGLTTRDPEKIQDLSASGFRTVAADFGDPDSLDAAFEKARVILLISATGPAEARIPLHRNAIAAAVRANPDRIVYTSRVNPTPESVYAYAPIHATSESLLSECGIPCTIVRNNEYSENLSSSVEEALAEGRIVLPGSSGKVPYISVADIARVLVELLLDDRHAGKTYEINGPEALAPAEIAQALEAACKRPIELVATSAEEYAARVGSRGRPSFVVDMVKTLHAAIDRGEFSRVYDDAERILGEAPESLSRYLERRYGE